MKRNFKKFVSVALSIMLCATAVPASFVAANAAGGGTVTPKVAVGSGHTVVLKSDGTVWATGNNSDGQLGIGSAATLTTTFTQCIDDDGIEISDAKDVACGTTHTAIIRGDNNEVWQCGSNAFGQLGNVSITKSPEFVRSYKSKTGDYIDKDSIVIDGDSANAEQITGATDIACGQYHTAVLLKNGEVWQCGYNSKGQLGINSTDNSKVFVKSYKSKTGDYIASLGSSDIEAITVATQIVCGDQYTAIICGDNKEVWQCGGNYFGQLGNMSVSSGYEGSCSTVFVKSSKYTNGSNGDKVEITGATQISCGYGHTVVLLENGEVWQCGSNWYGQLGNISVDSGSSSNYKIAFVKSYKSKTGDYIASPSSSDIEEITGVTQITCGGYHTAVIINGEVWQCGNNETGQLGNGSIQKSTVFVKSSNITNAKELSTGCQANCTMVLCKKTDGTYALYGAGLNNKGQLGLGNVKTPITTFTRAPFAVRPGIIDTITTENGSRKRNVTGTGQFVNAYKMEVEWGSLSYKYEAKWDTEKSAWGEGTWKLTDENDDDAGKIIVRNFSSVPCKSVFSFEPISSLAPNGDQPGTKGVFEDLKITNEPLLTTVNEPVESTGETEGTQKTTPVTSAILAVYTTTNTVGHQKTVKLKLEGIPESQKGTNISSGTNIGKTTVTFKKVS